MFDGLKESLKNATSSARSAVAEKEITADLFDDVFWELEQELLQNNVAVDVIDAIRTDMREELVGHRVTRTKGGAYIQDALKDALLDVLDQPPLDLDRVIEQHRPALILLMGFNGSGKTTTLAKLAHRFKPGYGVVLAAGDTFRSASIEQLQEHASALDVPCITHDYGSDAAAVIYDAREHAEKNGLDVILADTAGRSHSDRNLMEELTKIVDVNDPDCKLLVVDALAGNDLVNQAEEYESIGFDAIILTKADVDTKGGAALSLGYLTGKPILFLGTGQGYDDLERFDAEELVERLLGGSEG